MFFFKLANARIISSIFLGAISDFPSVCGWYAVDGEMFARRSLTKVVQNLLMSIVSRSDMIVVVCTDCMSPCFRMYEPYMPFVFRGLYSHTKAHTTSSRRPCRPHFRSLCSMIRPITQYIGGFPIPPPSSKGGNPCLVRTDCS